MTCPLKTKSFWWAWMLLGAGGCFAATRPDMIIQAAMPIWNFLNNNGSAIIATCALGVTFWQSCVTRKHNKLSVRPLLTTMESHDIKGNIGYIAFHLENCGVGPAIIKNFVLLYGDEEVARNDGTAYSAFLARKTDGCADVYTGFLVPGYALPAGTKHPLLLFSYDIQNKDVSFSEKLNLIVDYQSIYEDKVYTYDSRKDRLFHGREVSQ